MCFQNPKGPLAAQCEGGEVPQMKQLQMLGACAVDIFLLLLAPLPTPTSPFKFTLSR